MDQENKSTEAVKTQLLETLKIYYEQLKKIDKYKLVKYDEKKIYDFKKSYDEQVVKLENKMMSEHNPDIHKILAICIKSFLENNILSFNEDLYSKIKNDIEIVQNYKVLLPNEIFIINFISIIINDHAIYAKKLPNEYSLRLPDCIYNYATQKSHQYACDFVKLLRGYKSQKLDIVIQELAHILFFMEMGYELSSIDDIREKYYSPIEFISLKN